MFPTLSHVEQIEAAKISRPEYTPDAAESCNHRKALPDECSIWMLEFEECVRSSGFG
jgi:hypothetical protein